MSLSASVWDICTKIPHIPMLQVATVPCCLQLWVSSRSLALNSSASMRSTLPLHRLPIPVLILPLLDVRETFFQSSSSLFAAWIFRNITLWLMGPDGALSVFPVESDIHPPPAPVCGLHVGKGSLTVTFSEEVSSSGIPQYITLTLLLSLLNEVHMCKASRCSPQRHDQ